MKMKNLNFCNVLASLSVNTENMIIALGNCPEVFLGKGALKICNKSTGEHPCESAISIKLQSKKKHTTLRNIKSILEE